MIGSKVFTNSLAKLLSDSLLSDTLLSESLLLDSLLSDSSMRQSYSKLKLNQPITFKVVITCVGARGRAFVFLEPNYFNRDLTHIRRRRRGQCLVKNVFLC